MTAIDLQQPALVPTPPPVIPAASPAPRLATASPLTPEHLAQLTRANQQSKKLRRAQRIAASDAWLSAIFAAITLLTGLFSLPALGIGLALALVAFNSFRGLRLLKDFDPRAARLLGYNQLFLAAAITTYALYCLYAAAHSPSPFAVYANDPQLAALLQPYDGLAWLITCTVYLGVIFATLLAQGLTALYYFTRAKPLTAYRTNTPQWIRDLQRAQSH